MAMKSTMSEGMHDEGMHDMDSLYGSEGKKDGMEHETVDQEEMEHAGETAMVPTKLLQYDHPEAPKAGEEYVVKVVKNYGDECEVEYSTTKPGDIGGEKEMSADEEIDKMDNPGKSAY